MWTLTVTGPNKPTEVRECADEAALWFTMMFFGKVWKAWGYTHWEVSRQWPVVFPMKEESCMSTGR